MGWREGETGWREVWKGSKIWRERMMVGEEGKEGIE